MLEEIMAWLPPESLMSFNDFFAHCVHVVMMMIMIAILEILKT
ncbi:LOW QUALITY PROTEIN: hypothetical protein TorRG33x02_331790 [Trema orientale]|uniref:Uncharacterized protein n=1 Tax=Trema orientale TaxID=63057 RepID=A0A2P5B5P1_TREOI|nr:LOW QUALITY PROTEIN: hypothetical protein TorRG33x02_331790 [Trema orientale]